MGRIGYDGANLGGLALRAYSADLRQRVLAAVVGGHPPAAVAARFGVSASWVRRVRPRHRDGGATGPRPDATLTALKARLGLAVHRATPWRAVARLGRTLQQSPPGRPNRTART